MPVNKERIQELFTKFADNACTQEELQELYGRFREMTDEEIHELMDRRFEQAEPGEAAAKIDWEQMFAQVVAQRPARVFSWRRVAVAAVILLSLAGSLYFWFSRPGEQKTAQADPAGLIQHDVTPGGNKAILILADGSRIALDSAQNGTITQQGDVQVIKPEDGQLGYQASRRGVSAKEIVYNTLATPRGGQYRLTLPDGSQVWLNAASSIRFPTAFNGKERQVEVTGEAYFEIAHNAAMPFKVLFASGTGQVEVLGTHFNINTYDDEAIIKTTLVEGSIKVVFAQNSVVLTPGQQARYNREAGNLSVNARANTEQAIAWKNGLFDFTDDAIPDIMRRLARWYDVDIVYNGKIPEGHYVGAIRRQVNISEVLNMLELAGGVQFAINDKKIMVNSK